MSDLKETFDDALQKLRQERDELRVRMKLAEMEVRDEWEAVEKRWHQLESRAGQTGDEVKESLDETLDAARIVGDEIRAAYARIRERLND